MIAHTAKVGRLHACVMQSCVMQSHAGRSARLRKTPVVCFSAFAAMRQLLRLAAFLRFIIHYAVRRDGLRRQWQHTRAQAIERTEVNSTPGATLSGVNAVNGVLNVITGRAIETAGISREGRSL